MEYISLIELYRCLIPVFNVKKRLISNDKELLTNKDIWEYLTNTKWKYSYGLTLADMVNDIITVDSNEIIEFLGGKKWKKEKFLLESA